MTLASVPPETMRPEAPGCPHQPAKVSTASRSSAASAGTRPSSPMLASSTRSKARAATGCGTEHIEPSTRPDENVQSVAIRCSSSASTVSSVWRRLMVALRVRGIRAAAHVGAPGSQRAADDLAHLGVGLGDELGLLAVDEVEHVLEHQHLARSAHAGADADGGHEPLS